MSTVDPSLFARYVPLNALSPERQADLARKSTVTAAQPKATLFKIGDIADRALFLLSGEVRLLDAQGNSVASIRAGDPASFHRLAHQSPRGVSAVCATDVSVLAVDSGLLDVMLTWDQTGSFEVGELNASQADSDSGDDWMTRLLQMRTFQLVPPSNLQAMFMRMQQHNVEPGTVIVKQDDVGDYFYVVMSGRCIVTREQTAGKAVRLAELEAGSCFGEEALISDSRRNATVTALVRSSLMRLSKDDFRKLLNEPLAR
ncbi:MAG TPA: cyclic nucleotide-binding domain-containing protein, partial [Fontimonas sp.]